MLLKIILISKEDKVMKPTLWKLAVSQMTQDHTYLFNKDTICNFHFELKHDLKWWLKVRKWNWIGIWTSFSIFFIVGLIVCLLQIWYNKEHPYTNEFVNPNYEGTFVTGRFICAGIVIWLFYMLFAIIYGVYIMHWFNKTNKMLFPFFSNAVREGYLCSDESKYPDVIRMAFYYNDGTLRWRMNNPTSRFQYVMPLYGLVAILSSIKDYQAKYCNVPQLDNQSK